MKQHIVPTAKRLMDVLFGTLFLVMMSPIMAIVAGAVKLTSNGPVFYRQRKAGALSPVDELFPEFYVYKFRTMYVDAEIRIGAVLLTKSNRVTPIGSFLRRTRLDELPQFINVIKGDMSLVGPRPERPELMEPLSLSVPFFEERLRGVKPGITGLAQIKLNYDGRLPQDSELAPLAESLVNPYKLNGMQDSLADGMRLMLLYDLAYVTSLERFGSFIRTDLAIIAKTPFVMFFGRQGQ